jgi:hypothetical protein
MEQTKVTLTAHRSNEGTYARWLFGSAAIFNLVVGAALLLLWPWLALLLKLDPAEGSNMVLRNLTAGFVALFGYAFALIALNPLKNRPLIPLGAIGKLLAVASVVWPWLMGVISANLPLFIIADLIYAALFLVYLRQTANA